jgi:hydrogenase expression/formation protein HypE
MLAREQFGMRGDLASDAASVLPLTQALVDLPGLRFMRDPTRGGLATVCHEISRVARVRVVLHQTSIPVRDPVLSVCEILGYDPLFLACEGRVLAVVAPEQAEEALVAWRQHTAGRDAAIVGEIDSGPQQVEMVTELGGSRLLQELEDDPLPRIC